MIHFEKGAPMKIISAFFYVLILLCSSVSSANDSSFATQDQSSEKVPVSTGKYITGGVIGSVVGLGIGHGIQGRYQDKGWIFTATEAAGITVVVAGAARCINEKDNDKTLNDCSSSTRSQMALGYLVALGFHIWEVVDVWTGAQPVDDKLSAMIIPGSDSTTLGFVYKF